MALIRPATEHDAGAIARVHVESWGSTYAGIVPATCLASLNETERTQQWNDWLKLEIPIHVAERDGDVVGFIAGGPLREPLPGYNAELFTLYLRKSAQRRGIGTALLKTLADALLRKGLTAMIAWVLESNSSRHFYEHTGAHLVQSKPIDIGGTALPAQAYGWPALAAIL